MKQLHYSWQDGVAAALTAACIAVVVVVNIFAPVGVLKPEKDFAGADCLEGERECAIF